ncbi:MAG: hypothetical protein PHE49_03120 [bacterium]|nr:hypothetical protein [bacterium]
MVKKTKINKKDFTAEDTERRTERFSPPRQSGVNSVAENGKDSNS